MLGELKLVPAGPSSYEAYMHIRTWSDSLGVRIIAQTHVTTVTGCIFYVESSRMCACMRCIYSLYMIVPVHILCT